MSELPRHIDQSIYMGEAEVRRYAEIAVVESHRRFMAVDPRKEVAHLLPKAMRKKFLAAPVEELLADVTDLMSIGREPVCDHGLMPRARCHPCMVDGAVAICVQRIVRILTGHEMSDEDALAVALRHKPKADQ